MFLDTSCRCSSYRKKSRSQPCSITMLRVLTMRRCTRMGSATTKQGTSREASVKVSMP